MFSRQICTKAMLFIVCDGKRITETLNQNFSISPNHSPEQQVIQMREQFCNQMWEHFKCPITQDLMRDPVISTDGHTVSGVYSFCPVFFFLMCWTYESYHILLLFFFQYEREAIVQWLKVSNKSPLTGLLLQSTTLLPNHNLKSQIIQFCGIIDNTTTHVSSHTRNDAL